VRGGAVGDGVSEKGESEGSRRLTPRGLFCDYKEEERIYLL
jgi:hypothetical protein